MAVRSREAIEVDAKGPILLGRSSAEKNSDFVPRFVATLGKVLAGTGTLI